MDAANNKRLREEAAHHEQTHNIQNVFAQHVSATGVFEEMGNIFLKHSNKLGEFRYTSCYGFSSDGRNSTGGIDWAGAVEGLR